HSLRPFADSLVLTGALGIQSQFAHLKRPYFALLSAKMRKRQPRAFVSFKSPDYPLWIMDVPFTVINRIYFFQSLLQECQSSLFMQVVKLIAYTGQWLG